LQTQLAESSEDSNSSLAQLADELWTCKDVQRAWLCANLWGTVRKNIISDRFNTKTALCTHL